MNPQVLGSYAMSVSIPRLELAPIPADRETVLDSGAILAVPVLLASVHFLVPGSVRDQLAFYHGSFDVLGLYTSAFVHVSVQHLLNNITAYLLAGGASYLLAAAIQSRDWFRRTFVVYLVVLPPLVTLSSYAFFQVVAASPEVGRGFSGVSSGVAGLLLVATTMYVRDRFGDALANVFGVWLAIAVALQIFYIYAGRLDPVVLGLAAIGLLVPLALEARTLELEFVPDRVTWEEVYYAAVVGLAVFVLGGLVSAMFPAQIVRDGMAVNIVGHYGGFVWGALLSIAMLGPLSTIRKRLVDR